MRANIDNIRETTKDFPRSRNGFDREIAVLDPATGRAIVTARIYQPGTQVTCLLWLTGRRGIGKSGGGGGGYHKPSAALQAAITDAGITLTGDVYGRDPKCTKRCYIDGVGDSAMTEACEAIARAVTGKRRFIVHVAHA